jgi:hypothetical protein
MEDVSETRLMIFDVITDTLVDLADPSPEEQEEIRENMMTAAEILMDRLGLTVMEVDNEGFVIVSLDLIGEDPDLDEDDGNE